MTKFDLHSLAEDLAWLEAMRNTCGWVGVKLIGEGERYAAVTPQLFNATIVVGLMYDEFSWEQSWSYPDPVSALVAWTKWDGEGDPSAGWIRHLPSNRRVSRTGDEVDQDGHRVGAVGVEYVRP